MLNLKEMNKYTFGPILEVLYYPLEHDYHVIQIVERDERVLEYLKNNHFRAIMGDEIVGIYLANISRVTSFQNDLFISSCDNTLNTPILLNNDKTARKILLALKSLSETISEKYDIPLDINEEALTWGQWRI